MSARMLAENWGEDEATVHEIGPVYISPNLPIIAPNKLGMLGHVRLDGVTWEKVIFTARFGWQPVSPWFEVVFTSGEASL